MRSVHGVILVALAAGVLLGGARVACAEGLSDRELFDSGVAALSRSDLDDAIDRFELLADRGVVDASASYDRGVAYARRGGSKARRSGDLGRAAAAFREALLLGPADADAAEALERVQHEIARRRMRTTASQVELRPALSRAIVDLLSEHTWAVLAAIASAVTTLGLAVRLFTKGPRVRLAGTLAASIGAVLLVVSGGAASLARRERLYTRPAVVIVEEARLLDDSGNTITGPGSVLPEGASVLVIDQSGTRARVEWGSLEGWLSFGQLRLLAKP